jgi:anti-sigma factor RsiW
MTLWERVTRWARKPFRGRATMLTCQEQVELLADYLDGTLPPETASALERHLEDCVACVNFTNTYKATKVWVRDLTYEEMPEDLKTRLSSFLKAKILQEKAGGAH